MATLPERIKLLRTKHNLKQEDVLKAFGISIRTYRRYETGEQEPVASTLWKIADFYGVSIDYLVGRTDEP